MAQNIYSRLGKTDPFKCLRIWQNVLLNTVILHSKITPERPQITPDHTRSSKIMNWAGLIWSVINLTSIRLLQYDRRIEMFCLVLFFNKKDIKASEKGVGGLSTRITAPSFVIHLRIRPDLRKNFSRQNSFQDSITSKDRVPLIAVSW